MKNYELELNEVILLEDVVTHSQYKGRLQLTLTSVKIVFEREKGMFKKEKELIDIVNLQDIKIYNNKAQINQKGSDVNIQTINNNIRLSFDGMLKANKFVTKIVDIITGTTIIERGTNKVKGAINTIDDVLGIDTRATLKGTLENGITDTLLKGIKKR